MQDQEFLNIISQKPSNETRQAIELFVVQCMQDNGIDTQNPNCEISMVRPLQLVAIGKYVEVMDGNLQPSEYLVHIKSEIDQTCIDCKDFKN